MSIHELAGTKVRKEDYIDLQAIAAAYHNNHPDVTNPQQQVRFGTSGHRGQAGNSSFTDDHVAAIAQAVCNHRRSFGAEGPLFVGEDTHYLSKMAYETVLEVLAANGVTAYVDSEGDFVPTPSVSRAILRYNDRRNEKMADGLIITPSHNPPEHGGIKYNPVTGGPAGSDITKMIETEANQLLAQGNVGVKRLSAEQVKESALVVPYDYKGLYVAELDSIIDMDAIRNANLRIMVNALGGSGMNYWHKIAETYSLPIDFVNDTYDPQFTFMNYDHDGKVRMDCSSKYVMSAVTKSKNQYDLILANDPDYDRFGIISGAQGMITANAYLTVASHYLMTHRNFAGRGIAKTVVTTDLLARSAKALGIPCYEVPVGFKYFGSLYTGGKIAFSGEESAGASFVAKDGSIWTTDKDGMIMCLLACEIKAVTGTSPIDYYNELCSRLGRPYSMRSDSPATLEEKAKISSLTADDVTDKTLCGSPITAVMSRSPYGDFAIGGVKIATEDSWVAARPSGTEDLYKLYAESFVSEDQAGKLLEEGKALISKALAK
ncbi:MAG: phosphoglucomutase [Megasphaera sp.]|jgi:phosphoglucomutase|nr:phosphoglucomutase [Megasphaera sp.]MCH4187474.1 phosphoglucomutase [Megasphaera sp.]MCH4217393.1 phosphoglucomutase [Megasphaera sp.]